MPTTFDTYFPYDAGAGANVTESQWRDMAKRWVQNGIGSGGGELKVSSDDSGMDVDVAAGTCWIEGAEGEMTGSTNLAISAADGTNDRIDLVIVRNDFVNNRIELDVLEGTPAASPVAPSLTKNTSIHEECLGKVLVPTGAVNVLDANIDDFRMIIDPLRSPGIPAGVADVEEALGLWVPSPIEGQMIFQTTQNRYLVYDTGVSRWVSPIVFGTNDASQGTAKTELPNDSTWYEVATNNVTLQFPTILFIHVFGSMQLDGGSSGNVQGDVRVQIDEVTPTGGSKSIKFVGKPATEIHSTFALTIMVEVDVTAANTIVAVDVDMKNDSGSVDHFFVDDVYVHVQELKFGHGF